ncbi:MAG: hypothetical protein N2A99_06535 [Carnobacterium alterfunditum]
MNKDYLINVAIPGTIGSMLLIGLAFYLSSDSTKYLGKFYAQFDSYWLLILIGMIILVVLLYRIANKRMEKFSRRKDDLK